MNDNNSIQDAREWIAAMNKVVRQCEDDLLAAFNAGQDYASRDEAPDFQAWLQRRNENRSATVSSRVDDVEALLAASLETVRALRAALSHWEAPLL